jgi:hypothetical protein
MERLPTCIVPFILSNKECRTTDSEQQAIDPKRICKYCGWNMDIEYAYARGKLNEQHYNLLNKKIESFVNSGYFTPLSVVFRNVLQSLHILLPINEYRYDKHLMIGL